MATRTCGNCGVTAPAPFLAPPPESAPDLDGRPGEPARSTLHRWVQVCAGCGAAAPDLATLRPAPVPDEADPVRRWAVTADAAEAWLWAAWAADDAGDIAAARAARARSAAAWGESGGPADALRLADVLRRARDFAGADAVLDRVDANDDQAAAIAMFLRDRVAVRDEGRHMLSSALRPPARRPHVSHVQAKRRGLWSRMTGR